MKKLKILYFYLRYRWRKVTNLHFYQQEKLQSLFENVISKSPYYRNYSCWSDIPKINKKGMMANFDSINTKGLKKESCMALALRAENERDFSAKENGVTVGLSSGTSGSRGLFLADDTEEAIWAGHMLAKTLHQGILGKYNIAFFLRANSNLYENINALRIKMTYYDLKQDISVLMDKLEKQKPSILIAPAQVLVYIAKQQSQGLLSLRPERIYSVAEVLDDADREFVERIFGLTLDTIYQATEGFLGITCRNKRLHLNEEDLIIERVYMQGSKTRFHPVITDLHRRSQPIIKYQLDDILRLSEDQSCSCGNQGAVIEKVEGRSDDAFIFSFEGKDTTVFPDILRQDIAKSLSTFTNYMAIQRSHEAVSFYIDDHSPEDEKAIVELFNSYSSVPVKVVFNHYQPTKIENKLRRLQRTFSYE